MITVLTTFYHPRLGTVRGTVVDGVPMLSCREAANLLGCHDIEETENLINDIAQNEREYEEEHGLQYNRQRLYLAAVDTDYKCQHDNTDNVVYNGGA